jgi:thioredoxin 1
LPCDSAPLTERSGCDATETWEIDMAADADNLVHLNDLNWKEEVLDSKVPVLVDFSAVWCGPCKVLSPIIQKLSDELVGKVKVGKLDIDESPATSAKYGIRGVPTVAVFVGGERKAQHVGLTSRENLLKLLD